MIKFELNKIDYIENEGKYGNETEYIKRGYDFKHWCHA